MPVPGLSLLGHKRIRGFVSILRYINPTTIINLHLRIDNKIGLLILKTPRFYIKHSYISILYVQYLLVGTLQIEEHTHISQVHNRTAKGNLCSTFQAHAFT